MLRLERRKTLAMLDLFIATSREGLMTDLEIKQEVDSFVFGVYICNFHGIFKYLHTIFDISMFFIWLQGHDTITSSLSFILALLAEHKDIQVFIVKCKLSLLDKKIS